MRKSVRLAIVTPEVAPFARAGELAEFCSALPRYLAPLGFDISLIMPKYGTPQIASLETRIIRPEISVPLNGERIKASVFRADQNGCGLFFIDSPKYFLREHIYGPPTGNYLDNDERFVFFSRAALELLRRDGHSPDVIHCHNWPTALIPVFLHSHYREDPGLKSAASLLTLHNTVYQGEFPADSLSLTELGWDFFNSRSLSSNGKVNFLQAGVAHADLVNTVSSTYEKELLSRKNGSGLSAVLRRRRKTFTSVRNGLDRDAWNPEKDPHIAAGYGPGRLEGKAKCKEELIAAMGLALPPGRPLLAFISPLFRHKGAGILADSLEAIVGLGAGVVIAGEGEERFRSEFQAAVRRFRGRVAFRFDSSPGLVHKIIAGADAVLIPSLSEPSGLKLLAAFRYGTVPVVRSVGGLKEAVRGHAPGGESGNGFVFHDFASSAFIRAVRQAIVCYSERPDCWRKLMEDGMRQEFSWQDTARGYAELYEKALKIKRGG